MWTKELPKPRWLEGQRSAGVWRDRTKHWIAFLLAACNPRFGQFAAGDDGVAWLNGLRGFAAFLVYCAHHHQFIPHGEMRLTHAFGYDDEYYFGALPGIRWTFVGGGKIAVALFFAISGYVLSYSPLILIQSRPDDVDLQLATKMGTAFARRWLRLFLPVIVVTFTFMASWHLFHIRSAGMHVAAPTDSFSSEVVRWLMEFVDGSYVFHTLNAFAGNDYNGHMWSIAVEYRGSLLVYFWVLAIFALGYSPSARFYSGLALFLYFHLAVNGYYYAGFVAGILICDLTITADLNPSQLPRLFRSHFVRKQNTWICYVLLLIGIYLGSVPHLRTVRDLQEEPGWFLLSHVVPSTNHDVTWYFVVYAAALLVISIAQIPWLRRLFESGPAQYLGKISFGLYLVHGPLMWTIGDRIYAAVGLPHPGADERIPNWVNCFPISHRGPLGMEINTVLPHVILLPLSIYVAVLVTKLVDTPSVRLSKYLFGQRKKRVVEKSGAASWELEAMLSQTDERLPR